MAKAKDKWLPLEANPEVSGSYHETLLHRLIVVLGDE